MASSATSSPLRFLQPPSFQKPRRPCLRLPAVACAPAASPPDPPAPAGFEPQPQPYEAAPPPVLDLEPRRRRSAIVRERRPGTSLERPEPPNFQIGWKRTKEINNEKPKGWVIADFLDKLESLMGRGRYGSAELLAKVGGIVAERAREEADVLVEGGGVDERKVTELDRLLKLLEMDLEMVKAAVKEETLRERVETARARCRQAILVAMSF